LYLPIPSYRAARLGGFSSERRTSLLCTQNWQQIPGAPHLAGFSRDVGCHRSRPFSVDSEPNVFELSAAVSHISRKNQRDVGHPGFVANKVGSGLTVSRSSPHKCKDRETRRLSPAASRCLWVILTANAKLPPQTESTSFTLGRARLPLLRTYRLCHDCAGRAHTCRRSIGPPGLRALPYCSRCRPTTPCAVVTA
jgi:hypothetical protein